MDANKVLYINQEIFPYLPKSFEADLATSLHQGIQEKGFEVRTFMPKYGCINERRNQLHEVIRLSGMNLIINDTDHPLIIKVATLQSARMQVYFIYNDDYFLRSSAKEPETSLHPEDNDERSIFFVRGSLETVKKLRWIPNIVHCQGWISALTPLYLKRVYHDDPTFANVKVVYSLFSNKFDGTFASNMVEKLRFDGIDDPIVNAIDTQNIDYTALSKLAIDFSDGIIIAQEGVAPELIYYAKASGKPVLDYVADDCATAYADFYKSL